MAAATLASWYHMNARTNVGFDKALPKASLLVTNTTYTIRETMYCVPACGHPTARALSTTTSVAQTTGIISGFGIEALDSLDTRHEM